MMSNEIAVIICNYNKKDYVLQCVESVKEQSYKKVDIYVVDNASDDGSADAIAEKYNDSITLICNSENLGGSGGFNTGIREVVKKDYKYLVLLDNDVKLAENAIEELWRCMEANDDIGIQGCKILKMDYPDIVQEFAPMVDYERLGWNLCNAGKRENEITDEIKECDYVPACALIARCDVVRNIGEMPEENFVYYDDVEWCLRCIQSGYRVVANAKAVAWHKGGGTVAKNTFGVYYIYRNKIRFFSKYLNSKTVFDETNYRELEKRADLFLDDVFKALFMCNYTGRVNRAKTIFDGFLDALYGKTGKSLGFEIRDNEQYVNKFEQLVKNNKQFVICEGQKNIQINKIVNRIKELFGFGEVQPEIKQVEKKEFEIEMKKENPNTIFLCAYKHILDVKEYNENIIYVDEWCNIIDSYACYEKISNYTCEFEKFTAFFRERLLHMMKKQG